MSVNNSNLFGLHFGSTFSSIALYSFRDFQEMVRSDLNSTSFLIRYFNGSFKFCNSYQYEDWHFFEEHKETRVHDLPLLLGRDYIDQYIRTHADWPFIIYKNPSSNGILISNRGLNSPINICTDYIKWLKRMVEINYPSMKYVCISIPGNCTDRQKAEVEQAAKAAGIDFVKVITNQYSVLNYYLPFIKDKIPNKNTKKILFYDFCYTSLIISLGTLKNESLEIESFIEVNVGGKDFSDKIIDYYLEMKNISIIKGYVTSTSRYGDIARRVIYIIRKQCECLSKEISARNSEICIYLDLGEKDVLFKNFSWILKDQKHDMDLKISYDTFLNLNEELIKKILEPIDSLLDSKQISKDDIDAVLLSGDSSDYPFVLPKLEDYFDPNKVFYHENASAFGALSEIKKICDEYTKARQDKIKLILNNE